MTGTIKRIDIEKGFGFIQSDDKDYFFHRSSVKNAQWETLEKGDEVTFEDAEGERGPRAEDVFV